MGDSNFRFSILSPIDQELRICGGKEGGTYIKAAYWIARRLAPHYREVRVVDSSGSLDTHIKIAAGECDLGLAQGDSLPYFKNQSDELADQFSQITGQTISRSTLDRYTPVSLVDSCSLPGTGYISKVFISFVTGSLARISHTTRVGETWGLRARV